MRHSKGNPISRHSPYLDRTGLLAVQPHPQGGQAGAAPVKELLPCDPSQHSTWCWACQFLPDPVSDILSQRKRSRMLSSGQAYLSVTSLFCEHRPASAHSFPPHTWYPQEASKAQMPQWVLTLWSYLDSGRTLFSKKENPSVELFH